MTTLNLTLLEQELSIVQRPADSTVPEWAVKGPLFCVMRTSDELSIVCESARVPAGERTSAGWRVFKVEGPFAFDVVGVLAAISSALAENGVSLFALSTWDTDYILVREADVGRAAAVLADAGHSVRNLQS